ncbi:alkaline phosphatase family protein [Tundrisphaera lichenicola]|uniref:alkaline phosphatase family protein n=1 Tax=Tundrisphaera lichenicola TaxID=2029860 RepID=UPI003EB9BD70
MPSRILALACCLGSFGAATHANEPPAVAENVIVVTLDGFRHQEFFGGADEALIDAKDGGVRDVAGLKGEFWRDSPEGRRAALLPFFWGTIAEKGQVFGDLSRKSPARLTNGKKFSYPGYSEMFCGFGDDRIDSNAKRPNPNRSVLEFLDERPAYRDRVAAFCSWDVFPFIFRTSENRLKVHAGWSPIVDGTPTDRQRAANLMIEHLPRYWPDCTYDAIIMEAAREHLIRHKPRVLYIGLGETDEWAHGRRYDLYLRSAHQADRFLAGLWQTIQEMPEYRDRTALILTTDHGRGGTGKDWTDHGAKVEGAEHIWIALMGKGIPPLGVREGVESTQSQVASTIAQLIGEDFVAASPKSAPPLPILAPAQAGSTGNPGR